MHHKRKKPKNARAGCLMCKPWKINGAKSSGRGEHKHDVMQRDVWKFYAD